MVMMAKVAAGGQSGSRALERSPIDRVHLARYTLGNLDLEIEILGLFARQAPETLAQLRAAKTEKAWRDAAHTLKGSARAVGAGRVGDCAARAEPLGPADEAVRRAAIEVLSAALEDATAYIDGLSNQS